MTPLGPVRLGELAQHLGGELRGDADALIQRLGPLETADAQTLSFLANPRYQAQLAATQAGCVIVAPALADLAAARGAALVCADPYHAFARLTQWWAARTRRPAAPGVHASAVVEEGARIDAAASVGPLCFVGRGARIATGAVLGPHCHVGDGAEVGAGTWLKARVMLSEGCRIGARGIVHGGAVIGADGFGFAPHQGRWEKIEQLGAVVIGDDVEIGANTCIDRGALDDTVLGDGVKLDNLVQIGHNVRIGDHTAFAGCVGVAGSARIGRHCTAGGGAIILGHLEIVDHVHITAATLITRSIHKPGQYSGAFPFDDNAAWEKNAATLRQLHALRERLRALEKKNA
ncbi:MAG: UDP-3-O-(3-hydroxymyristoyl)glucosamine N-acyltransferase [Burkholderiaceae bacterium]|jgi:UDP-3-O-[3-hydroxymyristoyl] glucosamine N-acyltransferase|nr:UDP-3-O-(3-hydroxymyristoyl)glucosamine N-acyltransferase [Burkholderiaceae bacterium]MCZ8173903.1 UDP-3-O-(3-hydroxymyristoyl)glucosamine N-acyltransferase [Burkholderiaceae bacterium]